MRKLVRCSSRVPSRWLGARARRVALSAVLVAAAAVSATVGASDTPMVSTDRLAYAAGDIVEIVGSGFAPNEPLLVSVTHADWTAEPGMGHEPWNSTADITGRLVTVWAIDHRDVSGGDFIVTVSGSASGTTQSAVFHRRAVVETDQPGYPAGAEVAIRGRGFSPGETVTLQVTHADGGAEAGMGHDPWTTAAGEDGAVAATWSIDAGDAGGDRFIVSATGDASGPAASAVIARTGFVGTNKADYQPGETVYITGHGFGPHEAVTLQVTHTNGTAGGSGHDPFTTAADAQGRVADSWYVDPDDSLGSKFLLEARGSTTGRTASSVFWDAGTIILTALGTAYAQNFDTLASSGTSAAVPVGWDFSEAGANANTTYVAGTGSSNTGDTYSFGAAGTGERALGGLLSGNLNPTIGAQFTNNTGGAITSLAITYAGEMWRAGVTNRNAADRLDFQLSLDATSLTTGTWTDYDALDVNSPSVAVTAGALNGNADGNRTVLSATIPGLSIPGGATFWIRWTDFNITLSDDGLAIDDFSLTPLGGVTDAAPEVAGTFPVNGATDFPIGSNLSVTFSEPVNVTSNWFTLACSTSGNVATTYSGGPTTFTLDPGAALAGGETCTLTVLANQVSDQDGNDPPDNMVVNFTVGFSAFDACLAAYTPIYQIQGSGLSAAITGTVTTQGVVVGDFEGSASASGFYMQDPDGDGDPATSDGIFVYTGSSNLVSVGQLVRVTGYARERFSQTTLNGANSNSSAVPAANILQCGTGGAAPTDVNLPFTGADYPERYEGMLVRLPQSLVIADHANYDRFGEILLALPLAGEARPYIGTAIDEPGAAANARTLANSLSRITLDDAQSAQNPATLRHPNGSPFSLANRFRGGDTIQNVTGVLGYDFSLYRILPTGPADYTAANPRPASPEPVGGTVRVAAMNTLNYFLTADYPPGDPLDNKCGPLKNMECRGWDSDQPSEFARQRAKLLAAIGGLDADIVGLNELENTTAVEPLADLAAGLPGYAYINTGTIGTDAIRGGILYRPAVVTPVNGFQVLDSTDDPRFLDMLNRPTLAQTFEVNATGARFTVALNHFKSKGSTCDSAGDPDQGDGQGNCSQTRRAAAEALVDWLATDPTGSGDPDFLIVGDLNSYAREEPVTAIKAGPDDTADTGDDFVNLVDRDQGPYAYTYTFDGQAGYLDHALANASLAAQVSGTATWHINSDEPDVLDYDTSFKPPQQDALYEPNAYRTSDHDAVMIGLTPNSAPTVDAGGPYTVTEGGSVTLTATGSDPNGDALTYAWDLDNNGSFETAGQSVTFDAALLAAPSSYTVKVKATDTGGLSAFDEATVNVIYIWTGFFPPVDNLPTFNMVKAGSAIPVKFSLGGNKGLDVFAAGSPVSYPVACAGGAGEDPIEQTVTAGGSSLSYDAMSRQYTYVWKSDKAWANTCRELEVRLEDGTMHRATFHFTR